MNIKRLFEKTSTGLKEFVAKVDFANVIGLGEELAKYVKKDSDNEANVNYVNSTRNKTLTTGYNGIKYIVVNDEISDVVFNVNNEGVCNSKQFVCSSGLDKNSFTTIINSKTIGIFYNGPLMSTSINISGNSITFSNTSSFGDIEDGGDNTLETIYSIDNIKKGDFTYTFPDKSGTIELVDEDKDNKLNHIELVEGTNNIKFCNFASSFKSLDELTEYVNNNKGKITEAYTICNDETNTYHLSLGTDGALVMAQSGINGFVINYGNMEDSDITTDKVLGFNNEKAVFSSNLNLITDNNELYSLNLDKCIELGILIKR